MAGIPNITDILSLPKLKALREQYHRAEATALLSSVLPALYEPSRAYGEAINEAFYGGQMPEDHPSPNRKALSVQDRERCLIALLASRGVETTLAVHIYLGLMEDISVEEIANVLLLAGVYTGVDRFSWALTTYMTTLRTLCALVDGNQPLDARSVLPKISAAFEPQRGPAR
jgi:alkylhydroperoxidase/carboxymuconolactone decarboxylase family protein YurZ